MRERKTQPAVLTPAAQDIPGRLVTEWGANPLRVSLPA
jgi:hypothetical protein